MPYDEKNTETAEQLRKRIAREEAIRAKCPTPEEIEEMTAEIRAGWGDENGVLKAPPCNKGGGRAKGKYQPGIRVVANPARSRRGGAG